MNRRQKAERVRKALSAYQRIYSALQGFRAQVRVEEILECCALPLEDLTNPPGKTKRPSKADRRKRDYPCLPSAWDFAVNTTQDIKPRASMKHEFAEVSGLTAGKRAGQTNA